MNLLKLNLPILVEPSSDEEDIREIRGGYFINFLVLLMIFLILQRRHGGEGERDQLADTICASCLSQRSK